MIKTLTITEARRLDPLAPLWVLNNTVFHHDLDSQDKTDKQRANVVFSLRTAQGEVSTIPVFATWVPTCLSEVAPKDAILSSQAFMRAVNIGQLVIIDEASAEALLKKKGAREEMDRVRRLNINSSTGDALGVIEGDSTTTQIEQMPNTEVAAQTISAPVVNFIELMETGTPIETLNSLRTLGNLSQDEWLAVLRKARALGEDYKDVAEFCKERLNKKNAS